MKKTISTIIISLMTLCAQAQDLYIGSFYVTTPEEETIYGDGQDKWTKRYPYIVDLFRYEQPDVLGLQSLTSAQLSTLSSRISGYGAAGNILYNQSTVELDSCNVVEDLAEGCTCSWARLKKEGTPFYVFNICFTAENASSSALAVRTAITAINDEDLPCFVVGYLGANETDTAYSRLTSRFNDCFLKAPVVSAEYGTVNNFDLANNHSNSRFDFVMASKNVTVKAYGQLQSAYYTNETDGTYKRRLLSTHFPVMAKVKLP